MSTGSSIEWTDALIRRFWSYVDRRGHDECWPWIAGTYEKGYGQFRAGKRKVKAHRCAFDLSGGTLGRGEIACHTCDNPPCCNPAHLFAGTHGDNARDRDRKGRGARIGKSLPGESNPAAKLTLADVETIRRLAAGGETPQRLAQFFGVSLSATRNIVRGKSWRESLCQTAAQ